MPILTLIIYLGTNNLCFDKKIWNIKNYCVLSVRLEIVLNIENKQKSNYDRKKMEVNMSNNDMSVVILENLGGISNIESMSVCETRLRVNLIDNTLADKETLKNIYGVRGIVEFGHQLQIVLGEQTKEIADVFFNKLKIKNSTK